MSLFRIFPKSVEQKYEEKRTIVSNLVFVKCVFFFNFVLPFFFFFTAWTDSHMKMMQGEALFSNLLLHFPANWQPLTAAQKQIACSRLNEPVAAGLNLLQKTEYWTSWTLLPVTASRSSLPAATRR